MIAALERDEVLSIDRATSILVVDDVTNRRIHRIRAAEGKVDALQGSGRQLDEFCGQPDCGLGAEMKVARGIRQSSHLLRGGPHDALVSVADIDTPEAREGIEQFIAFGVAQIGAVTRLQDPRPPPLVLAEAHDGMDEMFSIEIRQGRLSHGTVGAGGTLDGR